MSYKNKEKQKEYQRKWIARRRSIFFADKKCRICECDENLQLHHTNPDTKISHSIWSWSESRQIAEVAKCIILCKNCHKKHHAIKLSKPLIHGTIAAYKGIHECRCSKCRESIKIYMQKYRRKMA